MSCSCEIRLHDGNINSKPSKPQSENNLSVKKKQTKAKPLNIAIGKFDTLHRGHQNIISKLNEMEGETAIISFDPLPNCFFKPRLENQLILPIKLKQMILSDLNVSKLFLINFDEKLVKLSPEIFMKRYLLSLQPSSIIVGEDFRFGNNRTGSIIDLASFCSKNNIKFDCEKLYEKQKNGSGNSSNLRNLIENGDVSEFNKLVGRPFMLLGRVVKGAKLGQKLGFRTANIQHDKMQVLPRFGSYTIRARFVNSKETNQKSKIFFDGVANFGCRPSITNQEKPQILLEAHLFDKLTDFYGKIMLVELISFIREEKKFVNIEQLKKQIALDIAFAKKNIYLN